MSLPAWRLSCREPEGFLSVPGDHWSVLCGVRPDNTEGGPRLPEGLSPRARAGILVRHFLYKTLGFWCGVRRDLGPGRRDALGPVRWAPSWAPRSFPAHPASQPGHSHTPSLHPLACPWAVRPRPISFPRAAASPRSPLPRTLHLHRALTQAPAPGLGGRKPRPRGARLRPGG